MSKNKEIKILRIKDLAKNKEKSKGIFASHGYSIIKKSYIDENGEQKEELIKIEIRPIGDHPLIKKYMKENPQPKPPVIRVLLNSKGQTPDQANVSIEEIKNDPDWKWANVYDYTDEEYKTKMEKYQENIFALQLMIVFDVVEEFGKDKIGEFKEFIEDLGFSTYQLQKIGEDIKNLDYLPN
ncbi:hypothetical protein LN42_00615 [Marinitoga sp. 1137]|uniref:hypothetical protein n=1 Tax=Marinitoga sp. 1137 TaxID=1545835 RepID=UPI0009508CF0|nr:hypothetical protein [Marinitoga sp. 1137]APT75062.1 hypothetical protein LN42_00615 [Marinitoga sp. 1137]